METYYHTEYYEAPQDEHAVYETAEDETAEEKTADDEHGEHNGSDDEQTEYDASEYEQTEYEEGTEYEYADYDPAEYSEHTEFHTDEFMSGAGALLRNQVLGQKLRLVKIGAKSGQVFGVTGARVKEKLTIAGNALGYGAFSVTHPFHPIRRRAAKDAYLEQKKLAVDRRRERVGTVKSNAAAKIAKAREGRIAVLEEGVNA
ncbi:unnamed protein product [Calypogeia fissa]